MVDYAVMLEARLDDADRAQLSVILGAMFPVVTAAGVRQAIDAAAS
jgi:hypothetical protein